jgi:hypothetical protein
MIMHDLQNLSKVVQILKKHITLITCLQRKLDFNKIQPQEKKLFYE